HVSLPLSAYQPHLHPFPTRRSSDLSDLARTGQEFLEASWTAASIGGAAPLDTSNLNGVDGRKLDLGASAYRSLRQVREAAQAARSEEHTSELQSRENLVCRLLLEKK